MVHKSVCVALLASLFASIAYASNDWVDWTTGATQPFTNSSGTQGTVKYTHNLSSVSASSQNSPDSQFPFTNPIKFLRVDQQPVDASIDFTFSNVSPDTRSIFTLGNLRPTNRYIITAFNQNNTQISLVTWTNYGEYRLFPNDDAPDTWNPNTGVLVGNGTNQNNGMNIFLGLTSDVHRIHVDFDNVDGGFEVLDFGLAGGGSASPVPMGSKWSLAILATLMTTLGGFALAGRRPRLA